MSFLGVSYERFRREANPFPFPLSFFNSFLLYLSLYPLPFDIGENVIGDSVWSF